MKIEKANLTVDGDSLRITMPLTKVDKKRRIVSGFATLDNVDKHGDVVTKEASQKAFADFLGNVRLMHQPIPAGKVMKFREEQYFDRKSKKVYNGIYVDAYISEGAENVWKMVNDGTLTGFSIGGDNVVAENEFSKDDNKNIRRVTGYRMNELSLVDNPANQFSNILSIQKSADGQVTAEGSLSKVTIENVFYCKQSHDPVSLVSAEETKDCLDCGSSMSNIGWFESDGGDRAEKVNAIINNFEADSTEGGENMAKEESKPEEVKPEVEEAKPAEVVAEAPKEAAPAEAPAEAPKEDEVVSVTGTGAEKVEEAKALGAPKDGDVKENPLNKLFEDLHGKIDEAFDKSVTKTTEALAEVTGKFEKELSELAAKHDDLSERFGTLVEKLDSVEKRFEGIEKSGAIKKSEDLGGSEEDSSIKKSDTYSWGGVFSVGSLG